MWLILECQAQRRCPESPYAGARNRSPSEHNVEARSAGIRGHDRACLPRARSPGARRAKECSPARERWVSAVAKRAPERGERAASSLLAHDDIDQLFRHYDHLRHGLARDESLNLFVR